MRSPVQSETSGITGFPQQIPEVVSGHLYKITKELMELDTSNTVSKEQFRQLCDRHHLSLTNDQVKPEKVFTTADYIPVHHHCENSKRTFPTPLPMLSS